MRRDNKPGCESSLEVRVTSEQGRRKKAVGDDVMKVRLLTVRSQGDRISRLRNENMEVSLMSV